MIIYTGKTRKARKWTRQDITWPAFIDRIKKPKITAETVAEYAAMPRDEQGNIKDVGGFVGGILRDGQRSGQTVEGRTLVTLDADYADAGFIDAARWEVDAGGLVYSTHKHTPEAPRFRLVWPLSRTVTPDEYAAIARRLAADVGIEYFDPTTFEPARLMFWPSASKDGQYVCESWDGPPVDADAVLATYEDWQDQTKWPLCPSETAIAKRETAQEDPTEKSGVIGAFCRTYTVQDAIAKFLPDTYTAEGPNRYTYNGASTTGGAVIYDDMFLFSHHATDPANTGHCLNAFDLVRIHRFADLDAKCRMDTPTEKSPSYKAAIDLAREDTAVKALMRSERLDEARAIFGPADEQPDADEDSWADPIDVDDNGDARNTLTNLHHILTGDPELKGIFYNDFFDRICFDKDLPWREVANKDAGDAWQDVDDTQLLLYLERYRRPGFSRQAVFDAVQNAADRRRIHPVRNYLNGLTWDGTARLDTLLIDKLGAEDTAYTRAVTRKAFTAAVARVMEPGCMFQYMLTLVGPQGIGKSTIISDMAHGWFTDVVFGIGTKDAMEQIEGFWLIEMSELAALTKADVEPIKAFISQRVDTYRAAYGRRRGEHPRQCVFVGTTNSDAFLRDDTGGRRFWPVPVSGNYQDAGRLTSGDIDQLWAEAVERYKQKEPLYLPRPLENEANKMQEAYRVEVPYAAEIAAWLEEPIPENWYSMNPTERANWATFQHEADTPTIKRQRVSVSEIWTDCLGGQKKNLGNREISAIRSAMKSIPGWEWSKRKVWHNGASARVFERLPTLPLLPQGGEQNKVVSFSSQNG